MSCSRFRRLPALVCCALLLSAALAGAASADQIAYVANQGDGTVTPIDLTTGTTATPLSVGSAPAALALTPDGGTLLVANSGDDTVTPVTLTNGATGITLTAGTPIAAGSRPEAIAVTADGMTAYVADDGSDTVTPITLEGVDVAGTPLIVASGPNAIALTPNGELAYVTSDSGWVTPIITSTNGISQTPPAIRVSSNPDSIAISPDGTMGYVTDATGGTITRFEIPSDKVEPPINVGAAPDAIAITPDGSTAWVADNIGSLADPEYALTEISLPSGTVGSSIALPSQASAITISPDGGTAYVTESSSDQVLPVNLAAGTVGTPITVGSDPSGIALTPTPGSGSSSGGGYIFPVNGGQSGGLGNQTLTLTTHGSTTSPTASCLAAKGTLTTKLTSRSVKHGAQLRFVSATVTLGRTHRRIRHLPATIRMPLRGLATGEHTLSATLTYAHKRSHGPVKHLRKTLHSRFKIC